MENKKNRVAYFVALGVVIVLLIILGFKYKAVETGFTGTIWSLLPPVVAITLALISKEVYSSLFLGCLVGSMQAASVGGGRIVVNQLDGIDVSFSGDYNTLVIRNRDENGSVAAVTSILNQSASMWPI